MIGIKINGEYLDMPEQARTQTERNTPLTAGDEILGEWIYPQNLPATEGNMRKLGFITELGAVKTKEKIKLDGAEYEEFNMLLYKGTLVAEYVEADLNNPENGHISAYFLTAISSFYSVARNVMLHQLELGGNRTIYDFPAHAKTTWTGSSDTFDYVFAPIKNNQYFPTGVDPEPDELDRFMNPIWDLGQGIELNRISGENTVMPFIYYKYLLLRCFEHFGYTVSGEILEDPEFKRAFSPNFQSIQWVAWQFGVLPEPINPVGIDLRRHVPKDYPVTKFLLNLANFFGLGYRINTMSRHCDIIRLNNIIETGQRKDLTRYTNPRVKMGFRKEQPVYALKLAFDPADQKASKPDLSQLKYYGEVNTADDLPPATPAMDNYYALLKYTNWFYVCKYDSDLTTYMWNYLADNIYDYEPAGNNQSIESAITPVSQSLARWREEPNDTFHYALMPEVRQEGNWPGKVGGFLNWEMRILFYHGLRPDNSGKLYPFASSHNYTYQGVKVADYSLALTPTDGIIARFWTNWLKLLSGMEEVEFLLYLNQQQYRAMDWTDITLIRNTPFLITKITPQSPYDDRCPCKALRLNFSTAEVVAPCIATVGDITVFDNLNGSMTVSFTEAAPGASSWQVIVDGGDPTIVTELSFVLYGVAAGLHTITITPICGDNPRPEGAASANFEIRDWELRMSLKAVLTSGSGWQNKLRLTIKLSTSMFAIPVSFKFGQCVINTSTGAEPCVGFPGSSTPNATTPVTLQYSTEITVDSTSYTPGANFGIITRIVLYDIVGIDPAKISKVPGEAWDLVLM